MQKRILTTLFLVGLIVLMLTLTLTQFATAEWKNNEFTNNTSGNLYVAFNTFRPAKAPIPLGWRTVGWYLIQPGKSHTFQAWADHPIYYLIWDDSTQDYLTPDNAKTFAHWEHLEAFVTVSKSEPNVPVAAAGLLYSNRSKGTLISSDFFKSGNGGSVTVTAAKKVVAPLAELETLETGEEADDTVSRPGGADDAVSRPGEADDTGVSISITPGPSNTPLEPGDERTLTISLNGTNVTDVRLFVEVDPAEAATLTKDSGKTDDLGEFETVLNVAQYKGDVNVVVTAYPGGTETQKRFAFTSSLIPGSLTITGDFTIAQGETGTVTATVKSPGGKPIWGETVLFSENSDHISLSSTSGVTGSTGKVSTTVTALSQGNAIISVAVDGYPALNKNEALSVGEAPPGSLAIASFSTSINEGDSRTITATVKSKTGEPLSGKTVRFQESSSAISFSSTSGTTNSSGQVSTTLRTSYVSSRTSATFYVKVDGYSGLDTSRSVTINQVASSLSVTGVSTPVYSGQSMTVKARVRSKGGYGMSGATVSFSENSSYLRFSYSSRTTDSSGYASSSLKTGGKTSGSRITISTSGASSKSYTIRVNPRSRTTTKYISDSGKRISIWTTNYWQNRNKTVYFPGNVISWKWRSENYRATVASTVRSGSTGVKVNYKILAKTTPLAWIRVWVDGTYEEVASTPGAPSLRPEVDQLSAVWQDLSQMPSETALLPNYPNPFNPETWIPYHLAEPASVTLRIYAADGTLVRTLVLGYQPAGMYENKSRAAYWDGRNSLGERVASGLYFYTFTAGDFAATKKMLIMK